MSKNTLHATGSRLALASALAFGGAGVALAAADAPQPQPHPLPKVHDLNAEEAARYVAQKAVGVCEYEKNTRRITLRSADMAAAQPVLYQTEPPPGEHIPTIIVNGSSIRDMRTGKLEPEHYSVLFLNTFQQACKLQRLESRDTTPKTSVFIMRTHSPLMEKPVLKVPDIAPDPKPLPEDPGGATPSF